MGRKVYAIVPSAGIGKRFGVEKNKPFFLLGGKPILVWCLEVLQAMPEITEIIPVVKEDDLMVTGELVEKYGFSKVRRIVPGGAERQDSVYNGLQAINDEKGIVLIHDGGRPFADRDMFLNAINQIEGCDGVIAAVRVKDTIKEIEPAGNNSPDAPVVRQTLNRELLYAVQTPQVFQYKTIKEAHEKARLEKYYGTDDAALVERYGGRIRISQGSYSNIKITTPEDIPVGEAILKKQGKGEI
jgi:2-C-methyl-D-erythritol 4-phosphate cytidylyltransferase